MSENELTPERLRRLAEWEGYRIVRMNVWRVPFEGPRYVDKLPNYTTDATAALRLVEKVAGPKQAGGFDLNCEAFWRNGKWYVKFWDHHEICWLGVGCSDKLFPTAAALAVSAVLEAKQK